MNFSKTYVLITAFLLSSVILCAQSYKGASKNGQYLRMTLENDVLLLRDKTDRYFTSGTRLEYLTAANTAKPSRFEEIIPKLKKSDTYLGLSIASNMYTPKNKSTEAIVYGDRPYAGWAYIGFMGVSNSKSTGTRLTTEYSLGAIGPVTQQEKVQASFHKFVDRPIAQGWKNQIANDIAANVFFSAEKRVVNPTEYLDVLGLVETNIGTVTNYMGVGGLVRVGWFEDYFQNVLPLSASKNWQAFIFSRPTMRVVMDNSLLQGGVFNYYNSPYVIPRDDLKHVYMETAFGYSLSYRSFNMTYSQNFRTSEFKDAKTMFWGAMAFSYGF
jgi:lipid A 3-O-deacylase